MTSVKLTFDLLVTEQTGGVRAKVTVWGSQGGRFGSVAVATAQRAGEGLPADPEAMVALAMSMLHQACYHS